MMNDALIGIGDMILADGEINRLGSGAAAKRLRELEPALFDFVDRFIKQVAGELILTGTPPEMVELTANKMMTLTVTALEATNRATYRLWGETLAGTPLESLRSLCQDRADGGSHPH